MSAMAIISGTEPSAEALDHDFTAVLEKSPSKGGLDLRRDARFGRVFRHPGLVKVREGRSLQLEWLRAWWVRTKTGWWKAAPLPTSPSTGPRPTAPRRGRTYGGP